MCGFVGFHGDTFLKNHADQTISQMIKQLSHRGPDSLGTWTNDFGIAFGHARLSIQDLSEAGNQPMLSHSERFCIVFNGELYNHLELRKVIEKHLNRNIKWVGTSDTETLLELIECFGLEKSLNMAYGMFAFSLYDSKTKKLYLARDRFGEKPLYYGTFKNFFLFGSELKGIINFPNIKFSLDNQALGYYFKYNYIPAPYCIFKNFYKLLPGHFLEYSLKDRNHKTHQYWSINLHNEAPAHKNYSEAMNKLEDSLLKVVESQMISDVPLGTLLSGGIDSSLVTALMSKCSSNKIKTFTIGFENQSYDESQFASNVAKHLGTDHTQVILTEKDCKEIIPNLATIYDEPFADSSQIPTFLVSKVARNDVTVVLTGDGADELFGGYNRYTYPEKIWKKFSLLPDGIRKLGGNTLALLPYEFFDRLGSSKLINFPQFGTKLNKLGIKLSNASSLEEFSDMMSYVWEEPNNILQNSVQIDNFENYIDGEITSFGQIDTASKLMYKDILNYLQGDILCKVDRASMAVSLETRAPFLDERIYSQSQSMPLEYKIHNANGKRILKDILYKYVPRELVERPKSGFAIPVGSWIGTELKDWTMELLSSRSLREHNLINEVELNKYLSEHLNNNRDNSAKLWGALMFQSWFHQYKSQIEV
jgi:asparagine synthase (glutamine-hydrolysing)